MASPTSNNNTNDNSVDNSVDSLITRFQQLLQATHLDQHDVQPEWIPCSVFSPEYSCKLNVVPARHGSKLDRRLWEIRKTGAGWSTITGSTGISEGVHYWEFKIVKYNRLMFGLLMPSDDSQLNVGNLWSHMGDPKNDLLNKYSISYYLQPQLYNYSWASNRGDVIDLKTTNYDGCRIGLLLDLVKCELQLFFFLSNNTSGLPDKQILLATLMKDKKYYPAFSLVETTTILELCTSASPPTTVKDYVDQINSLCELLRKFRETIAELQANNNRNEEQFQKLKQKYQQLLQMLNMS
jgi:hypothetical protein